MELNTSAAAERNKEPIGDELQRLLPPRGRVLEIASGTGQHAVHFALRLPGILWQPSDRGAEDIAQLEARRTGSGLANLLPAVELDVLQDPWPVHGPFDAVVCINMIHISPWSATLALLRGAARHLLDQGVLLLYGPFQEQGRHTAASNAAFDATLRERNPAWGVRELEVVAHVAAEHGLMQHEVVRMPANNLCVVFRRVS